MRKFIIAALLGLAINAQAIVTSVTVSNTAITEIKTLTGAPCRVTYILLSAGVTNEGKCTFYDSANTNNIAINTAYTNYTLYATNYITTWTNYYGATNSVTNVALIRAENSVAAATNALTPVFYAAAATNTSTEYTGLSAVFSRGIVVTNTGSGPITLSIGYTQ